MPGELRIERDRVSRLDDRATIIESRLATADLDLLRLLLSRLGEIVPLDAITALIGRGATRSAAYERVRSLRHVLGESGDDRGLLITTKRGEGWGIAVAHLVAIPKEIGKS